MAFETTHDFIPRPAEGLIGGLKKRLTPVHEARKSYPMLGVGIFVFNKDGEVLVIRENETKLASMKKAGEYGIPCETLEKGEGWEEAVVKGIHQELRIPLDRIGELFNIDRNAGYLGEGVIPDMCIGRVYKAHYSGSDEDFRTHFSKQEVKVVGWVKLSHLSRLNPLRKITKMIVDAHDPESMRAPAESFFLPLSVASLKETQLRCVPREQA